MTDAAKNVEIEDVLASIRRLVSDEGPATETKSDSIENDLETTASSEGDEATAYNAPTAAAPVAADALVLTPSLRVPDKSEDASHEETTEDTENADDSDNELSDVANAEALDVESAPATLVLTEESVDDIGGDEVADTATAIEEEAETANDSVTDIAESPAADLQEDPDGDKPESADASADAETRVPFDAFVEAVSRKVTKTVAREIIPDDPDLDAWRSEEPDNTPFPFMRSTSKTNEEVDSDEQEAVATAEGEEASASELETAESVAPLNDQDTLEAKIARLETMIDDQADAGWEADTGDAEPAMAWEDASAEDEPLEDLELEATASDERAAETLLVSEPVDAASDDFATAPLEVVEVAEMDVDESTPVAADEDTAAVPIAAETVDLLAEPDMGVIDEDMLRDMVTAIVREELQGALGERITRNVRKLVRREIHRVLASHELD